MAAALPGHPEPPAAAVLLTPRPPVVASATRQCRVHHPPRCRCPLPRCHRLVASHRLAAAAFFFSRCAQALRADHRSRRRTLCPVCTSGGLSLPVRRRCLPAAPGLPLGGNGHDTQCRALISISAADSCADVRTPTPPTASDAAASPLAMTPNSAQLAHSQSQSQSQSQSHLYPPRAPALSAHSSFASTNVGSSQSLSNHTSFTSVSAVPTPFFPTASASVDAFKPIPPHTLTSLDLPTLRHQLTQAQSLIASLQSTLSSLRTTAAHWQLQHKLLLLETSEARARSQVETDIFAAQVDVLRGQDRRRLKKAQRRWREAAEENKRLRARLRGRAGRVVADEVEEEDQDDEGSGASRKPDEERDDDAEDIAADGSGGEDDRLAALGFLASQVLSQEGLSHPPSPTQHPPPPSSSQPPPPPPPQPATPRRRKLPQPLSQPLSQPHHRHPPLKPTLLSPVAFANEVQHHHHHHHHHHRTHITTPTIKRRRSRDSTISVSDDAAAIDSVVQSPSPRKKAKPGPRAVHGLGLGTPVSPARGGGSGGGGVGGVLPGSGGR